MTIVDEDAVDDKNISVDISDSFFDYDLLLKDIGDKSIGTDLLLPERPKLIQWGPQDGNASFTILSIVLEHQKEPNPMKIVFGTLAVETAQQQHRLSANNQIWVTLAASVPPFVQTGSILNQINISVCVFDRNDPDIAIDAWDIGKFTYINFPEAQKITGQKRAISCDSIDSSTKRKTFDAKADLEDTNDIQLMKLLAPFDPLLSTVDNTKTWSSPESSSSTNSSKPSLLISYGMRQDPFQSLVDPYVSNYLQNYPAMEQYHQQQQQQQQQHYSPTSSYALNKAHLRLTGDLMDLMTNWCAEEWQAGRRLVSFWRKTNKDADGQVTLVECGFETTDLFKYQQQRMRENVAAVAAANAVAAAAAMAAGKPVPLNKQESSMVISCIYWKERNDFFITSVDCISLLENMIGIHFTVEEKNRIRRNLEGFRPLTVSKCKAECADFFKLIMGFPHPKPRNIEKDVKVFSWKTLPHALRKIIRKYTPSYTTSAPLQPLPRTQHQHPHYQKQRQLIRSNIMAAPTSNYHLHPNF